MGILDNLERYLELDILSDLDMQEDIDKVVDWD
jgi:glutaredoxin-related protein